ncbi:MAG: hypothetical protein C0485_14570 [Pirellula sp.]|nr:hypothetical protein [Pirellula sp.]
MKLKFSIRGLLISTSAIAVLLGYGQVRRQRILSDVEALKSRNVIIEAPHDAIDFLWQRVPEQAYVWLYDPEVGKQVERLGVRDFTWTCQR